MSPRNDFLRIASVLCILKILIFFCCRSVVNISHTCKISIEIVLNLLNFQNYLSFGRCFLGSWSCDFACIMFFDVSFYRFRMREMFFMSSRGIIAQNLQGKVLKWKLNLYFKSQRYVDLSMTCMPISHQKFATSTDCNGSCRMPLSTLSGFHLELHWLLQLFLFILPSLFFFQVKGIWFISVQISQIYIKEVFLWGLAILGNALMLYLIWIKLLIRDLIIGWYML